MSEDFSPLERLIANAHGKDLKSMMKHHQRNHQKPLVSFALSKKNDAEQLVKGLDACRFWIAVYDDKQQTLYTHYQLETSDNDHSINLFATSDMTSKNFKFVSDCSLQKSQYSLIPQYEDNQEDVALCKYLPNGEYAIFNLTRGLKEFVYSLTRHSPLLPVLCHDSLTMNPENGCHALRLYMLIIDNLDLHLEQSRKKIFDTMRQNIIDSYKSHQFK